MNVETITNKIMLSSVSIGVREYYEFKSLVSREINAKFQQLLLVLPSRLQVYECRDYCQEGRV